MYKLEYTIKNNLKKKKIYIYIYNGKHLGGEGERVWERDRRGGGWQEKRGRERVMATKKESGGRERERERGGRERETVTATNRERERVVDRERERETRLEWERDETRERERGDAMEREGRRERQRERERKRREIWDAGRKCDSEATRTDIRQKDSQSILHYGILVSSCHQIACIQAIAKRRRKKKA